MVGGAAMYPSKTLLKMQLIQRPYDISSSKAAGLVETSRKRPFTVLHYQCRFAKLPMGTVETLLNQKI
jgi:hypothetical protein